MRKLIVLVSIIAALGGLQPAYAWTHGFAGVTAPPGTQINLGLGVSSGGDLTSANFIDILKPSSLSFSGGATPGTSGMDSNGYATQSFTGAVNISIQSTVWPGPYTIFWTAGTKLQITNAVANSSCALTGTGGSVTGCSSNSFTLTIDGTGAGSMSFNNTGGWLLFFPGAGSYGAAGTASLAIVRSSDVTLYNQYVASNNTAGAITGEFKSVLQGGNFKTIRPMDWNNTNFSVETKGAYRALPSKMGWTKSYPLGAWAGGLNSTGVISGTDQYTAAAIAPDQPAGAWVQGEVIMGALQNAQSSAITVSGAVNNGSGLCRLTVNSTSTLTTGQQIWVSNINNNLGEILTACSNAIFTATVIDAAHVDLQGTTFSGTYGSGGFVGTQTLTVPGKTGTKFIASLQGFPPKTNFDSGITAGINTFSYDSVLDRVLYVSDGYRTGVPVETSVSIANQINANLWFPIPVMVDDAWMTSVSTVALSLKLGLYFMPEVSNEVWNSSFTQTNWAGNRGTVFGFPQGNAEHVYGYYGLRVRQIMGNLIPPIWSGRSQYLRPVLAVQACCNVSPQKQYRMEGADLAPIGTGTGKGNAAFVAFAGSVDYTTFPSRPIDVVKTHATAPYTAGTNLADQGLNGGQVATVNNAAQLQAWATAFAASPTDPVAIASLNNDQLQGTQQTQAVTCPTGSTFTLNSNGFANGKFAIFTAFGGTVCGGLSLTQAYCITGVTTNTFQVAAFNLSSGNCGTTPIAVTPGTGTVSVGLASPNVPFVLNSTYYPMWEAAIASYDSARTGAGMPMLREEWYEGGNQPIVPNAAALTALGVLIPAGTGTGAAANAALIAGVTAWRNDPVSRTYIQTYYNQFMAYSHSKTPSNLVLLGPYSTGNPYGLVGSLFPLTASEYQTFVGTSNWTGGTQNFLLKRDIDPASNDNDPMWLEKAA